jgi:hypothetical protein
MLRKFIVVWEWNGEVGGDGWSWGRGGEGRGCYCM